MKSSIKIDLGENNAPVIEMKVVLTDDVRDKLCKQFAENLRGSSIVYACFDNRIDSDGAKYLILSPLHKEIGDKYCHFEGAMIIEAMDYAIRSELGMGGCKLCMSGYEVWWIDQKEGIEKVSPSLKRNDLVKCNMSELYLRMKEVLLKRNSWGDNTKKEQH